MAVDVGASFVPVTSTVSLAMTALPLPSSVVYQIVVLRVSPVAKSSKSVSGVNV